MEVSWSCVAPTRGSSSEEMREGDVVMVYLGPEKVTSIHLTAGESFENKFGRFDHTSFIGAPFGGRVYSSRGHWVLALAPTPELWALALRHRTQIVQSMDSAMVAFELGLRDGSVLMEAGTGSGAATVAFARACAPTGRVHTFECNESRATEADADFERLGIGGGGVDDVVHKKEDDDHQGEEEQGRRMPENAANAAAAAEDGQRRGGGGGVVRVHHLDVCGEEGTSSVEKDLPWFDAVFLDLPEPWRAMDFVKRRAKPQARIACYSPCVEQVQRTCVALRETLGADDLVTIEARLRDFDVRPIDFPAFAEAAAKEIRDDDQPAKKRPRLAPDTQSVLCAKPAAMMRGHTAFLTFATVPPSEEAEDS